MLPLLERIRRFWCLYMHTGITWPFRGHYRCRVCLREYPVA